MYRKPAPIDSVMVHSIGKPVDVDPCPLISTFVSLMPSSDLTEIFPDSISDSDSTSDPELGSQDSGDKMNPATISLMMRASCLLNTIWPKQRAWMPPSFNSSSIAMALRRNLTRPTCTGIGR